MITKYWCWSHTIECDMQCILTVSKTHNFEWHPSECPMNLVKNPIWKTQPTAPDMQE